MSDPNAPPPAPRPPRKPLGILRGIAAAVGILIMALSGGCILLLAASTSGNMNPSDLTLMLTFAGPPFLIGLGIWWLAVKVGR